MGSSLSNQVGYGLMIPYTEEEYGYDEEKLPEEWVDLLDEFNGDTWNLFRTVLKEYPDLVWESSYIHDYSGPTVIYVDALTTESYGAGALRAVDKIMHEPDTYGYDKQLVEIANKIGMPPEEVGANLGVWSVVSYG